MFNCLITGQIPANQEIWIFGDELLHETRDWLTKLEFAYLNDNSKPQLYIHDHYNVKTYLTPPQGHQSNFIKEIRNEIANTILRKVSLPHRILILLSSKRLEDPVFAIECMEGLLRWLMDEIEDILKFQKRCLPDKAKIQDAPRVYFLKILPKPNEAPNCNLFKGVRRKFNSTLQNMLQSYHSFGFINIHEITTRVKDEKFFISNQSGSLSDEGSIQFWESISQTFKAIDQILKPKTTTKNQASQWDPKDFRKDSQKPLHRESRENSYYRSAYQGDDFRHYENYETDERYSGRPYYSKSYYY